MAMTPLRTISVTTGSRVLRAFFVRFGLAMRISVLSRRR
jgi:hypothetical protein